MIMTVTDLELAGELDSDQLACLLAHDHDMRVARFSCLTHLLTSGAVHLTGTFPPCDT